MESIDDIEQRRYVLTHILKFLINEVNQIIIELDSLTKYKSLLDENKVKNVN